MPSEKDFETVLAKYPELIEDGLKLVGRQVTIQGRRMDLLFQDRLGRPLIAELKWGPVKDEHVGQLMAYEGMLLSSDNPSLRVVLVATRVPPNFRHSLDHHGIAWREIAPGTVVDFLRAKRDSELLALFDGVPLGPKAGPMSAVRGGGPAAVPVRAPVPANAVKPALLSLVEPRWLAAAFDHFSSGKRELYFVTNASIGGAERLPVRHVYFKRRGEPFVAAKAAFIDVRTDNPAGKRLDVTSETGRYYYGFHSIEWLNAPIPLTNLRYFRTGNALRNDVPGACIIQDPVAN